MADDYSQTENWGRTLLDDDAISYVSADSDLDDDDDDDAMTNRSTRTLSNIRQDVKIMNVVRAMFILAIVTVAVLASECVYIIATLNESSNFQEAYELSSKEIIDHFYKQVDNLLWNAKGITTTIGISYQTSNWPNVTISKFPALCESTIALSHASSISFQPLVSDENRISWEKYASLFFPLTNQDGPGNRSTDETIDFFSTERSWKEGIYIFDNGTSSDAPLESAILFPIWQMHPLPSNINDSGIVGALFDDMSNPVRATAIQSMLDRKGSTISSFLFQDTNHSDVAYHHVPRSNLYYPILDFSGDDNNTRGSVNLQIKWEAMLQGATLDRNETLVVVVDSSCGGTFTYKVQGDSAFYFGPGQLQNKTVNGKLVADPSSYEVFLSLFNDHGVVPLDAKTSCSYKITIYASQAFKDVFHTSKPNIYRAIVFVSLLMLTGLFIIFDIMVGRHQKKMLDATKQSDAIVRSLFPDAVADKLYEEARKKEIEKSKNVVLESKNKQLRSFMKSPTLISESNDGDVFTEAAPIAELFTDTTILFADFVGFTAWCSEREPVQVFTLLETVYCAMDKIGRRMNVFKVETIGDCYVAATGLPEPQADHAERMVMFAFKCLSKMKELTKKLESQLGPGTSDLGMRMGIHSGPITAGVVRGRNARFQLFGDTMNVASRIEASGKKNKIHISRETALLLKPHLVVKREDIVTLKGKGEQQTYWFNFTQRSSEGSRSSSNDSFFNSSTSCPEPLLDIEDWEGTALDGIVGKSKANSTTARLVLWNVDILKPMLGSIIARRDLTANQSTQLSPMVEKEAIKHEVQVIINMEKFDAMLASNISHTHATIPQEVESELRLYIATIASGYPNNPFHSFEHCSHVVMSASKLMKRILASEEMKEKSDEDITLKHLHDHTFGIATDPLCQFAVVFSALVHDVGHPGVPNARLAIEDPATADRYENRSIAEQRSLDVAFDLLNLPNFENLRRCIYSTEDECKRFRQLVVNSILATDIADKDMKLLRDTRWNTAFQLHESDSKLDDWMDRKATIVIEHIIQASDVAHTMQHFIIYQRWNERLFQELYFAYLAGRLDKDPSLGWYGGELWFFDNYIIPLAKKLKDCGVFGVSSDEYLHYATQNRYEWEQKGHLIVKEMKERADAIKATERSRNRKTSSKSSSVIDASKGSSNSVFEA